MQVISTASTTPGHDPKTVNASYSRISEAFRHVTAGPLQCQVFCGGRSCKYERSDAWSNQQMAISGLFSHWVTEHILAMARPNYTEMKKHHMIDSFVKAKISTIINLQETGEHASCGNALHSSGFSYDPIEFMNNGIFYYNFNIQDYSVPLQRTLLDICKVVTFAQSEGRVGIHCHAGLGRTGVVIACFLVYHHKMKPKDAVLLVRKNRPRSIQTRNQLKAVFRFANFLAPLWVQFPAALTPFPCYTLEEIVANQKIVLHGNEGKILKYMPKIVYLICSLVLEKVGQNTSILYKKIRPSISYNKPLTLPSSYEVEIDDDLDSLPGSDTPQKAGISDTEVDEIEAQMSTLSRARSAESLLVLTRANSRVVDPRISCISHRLNLSPRTSLTESVFATSHPQQLLLQPEPSEDIEQEPFDVDSQLTNPTHTNDHGGVTNTIADETVASVTHTIADETVASVTHTIADETVASVTHTIGDETVASAICPHTDTPDVADYPESNGIPLTTAIKSEQADNEDHVNGHDKTDASIDKDYPDKTKEDPKHSNDKTPSVEDSNKAAPPSSLVQLSAITDDTRTYVSEFMSGLAGTESTDELFDIGLVISQINVGIWESLNGLLPLQLGSLLRTWFTSLSCPVLTIQTVEMFLRKFDICLPQPEDSPDVVTPGFQEKVSAAFDSLSPAKVATIHCVASTLAVLLYGPFKLEQNQVMYTAQLLLIQKGDEDIKVLTPILSAILLSKQSGIATST